MKYFFVAILSLSLFSCKEWNDEKEYETLDVPELILDCEACDTLLKIHDVRHAFLSVVDYGYEYAFNDSLSVSYDLNGMDSVRGEWFAVEVGVDELSVRVEENAQNVARRFVLRCNVVYGDYLVNQHFFVIQKGQNIAAGF